MPFLEQNEAVIRMSVFAGVFTVMAILETLFPRKTRTQGRLHRWTTNWILVVANTAALRVILPVLAVEMALISAANGWGLLNLTSLPVWMEIMLAVLALDCLVYAQHVATHKIPILWRLHKVHHADRDIDVTTGARFHPVEIVLSMVFKLGCVLALGPSAAAVILFEVILNASAMFNHSNVKLPIWADRVLRVFIVTPDVHRVHHSVVHTETDSNYGFFLTLWDRLFGTYTAQPSAGHDGMTIGLSEYQSGKPAQLLWSLFVPFQMKPTNAAPRDEDLEVSS